MGPSNCRRRSRRAEHACKVPWVSGRPGKRSADLKGDLYHAACLAARALSRIAASCYTTSTSYGQTYPILPIGHAAGRARPAASVITTRLEDPKAVYVSSAEFGAKGDGLADDSAALQAAIDKAENRAREGMCM